MKNRKIRVLICEDNSIMLRGLHFLLNQYDDLELVGYALDGSKAIERDDELQPDVILMDSHMPNMDGVNATKIIKARRPSVRVIMISAADDQAALDQAKQAGADGYVVKPVMDPEELYYLILKTVESKGPATRVG